MAHGGVIRYAYVIRTYVRTYTIYLRTYTIYLRNVSTNTLYGRYKAPSLAGRPARGYRC